MKEIYAKCVLYAYPVAEEILEQIDETVLNRAIASMNDFSPTVEQCEKIIEYTEQKKTIILLCKILDDVLVGLSKEDKDLLDYKYFKMKSKDYYDGFDYMSRAYFRRQSFLSSSMAKKLENRGLDDKFFTEKCLSINFFKMLLKQVKDKEILSNKNKTKAKKPVSHFFCEIKDLSAINADRKTETKSNSFA